MRIRTIKPEMWTDGKMVRLSDAANLLFIALLNQADDKGRLKNDPKEIECKAPRFWGRSEDLIKELAEADLVDVYGRNGLFVSVKNFTKHQVIDRPRPSEIPSPKTRRTLADHSTQGEERKGEERKGSILPAPEVTKTDYQRAVDHLLKTWVFDGAQSPFRAEDGKTVKELVANYGLPRTLAIMDVFWTDCDPWTQKNIGRNMRGLKRDLAKVLDNPRIREIEKKHSQKIIEEFGDKEGLKKVAELTEKMFKTV